MKLFIRKDRLLRRFIRVDAHPSAGRGYVVPCALDFFSAMTASTILRISRR